MATKLLGSEACLDTLPLLLRYIVSLVETPNALILPRYGNRFSPLHNSSLDQNPTMIVRVNWFHRFIFSVVLL